MNICYDIVKDVLVIDGVEYPCNFFRELANSTNGQMFVIGKHWLSTRYAELDEKMRAKYDEERHIKEFSIPDCACIL